MKLAKLSLVTITVAGLTVNTFAADSLADAFKNGKATGLLKAWYFDRDTNVANKAAYSVADAGKGNASILNTGLVLNYVTDSLYGFKLGATMQSNFAPFATDDAKNLYSKDEYGSGAVLSEAYAAYAMKDTQVKIGRQFISTPLIAGSGTRMVRESFEGATIINTDLPSTTLTAIYVSKFQGRTSKVVDGYDSTIAAVMYGVDSEIPEFSKVAVMKMGTGDYGTAVGTKAYKVGSNFSFDGIYAVGVINKSIPNLRLDAQYAQMNNALNMADIDLYTVEANYVLPMNGFKLGFDAQLHGSQTDTALDAFNLEGIITAARISVRELAGFDVAFAYATTSKNDAVINGIGGGSKGYTSTLIRSLGASLEKDTNSYLAGLYYNFSKAGIPGLKALVEYGVSNQNNTQTKATAAGGVITSRTSSNVDYRSYAAGLTYDVPALKGLNFTVQYETQEKKTGTVGVDTDEFRFMANYKF